MFPRHRVCSADRVGLICSCTAGGRVWVFSLSHTAPGFQLWFYFLLCMWVVTGVCSRGRPGGLGFAPVRARCGGGAAAWVAEVLAAPGPQGSWRLGQQEIYCSRRLWQAVFASTLQYSLLENPLTEKPGRPQSTGSQRVGHGRSDHVCIDARFSFLPVASLPQ